MPADQVFAGMMDSGPVEVVLKEGWDEIRRYFLVDVHYDALRTGDIRNLLSGDVVGKRKGTTAGHTSVSFDNDEGSDALDRAVLYRGMQRSIDGASVQGAGPHKKPDAVDEFWMPAEWRYCRYAERHYVLRVGRLRMGIKCFICSERGFGTHDHGPRGNFFLRLGDLVCLPRAASSDATLH